MKKIVGVRFRGIGKAYYFDPQDFNIQKGDSVIVETARGMECGEVTLGPKEIREDELAHPLKSVVRVATGDDLERVSGNRKKEKDAYKTCNLKIGQHNLEMKLVDVEYAFDGSKIVFFFTADGRVDFRDLVKDLAGVFRTRIELRQIGVRDESKMLGGVGICGRPFCCSRFMFDFQPVSIKMAKEQGMSLNPVKISGTCGRLMCCLKYEQDVYESLLKTTPKPGASVETPDGGGTVTDVNLLSGTLKVRMADAPDAPPKWFRLEDLTVLHDRAKPSRNQSSPAESGGTGGGAAKKRPKRAPRKPGGKAPGAIEK